MNDDLQSPDIKRQRARAVRTALILGFIALAIFATFIGSAVVGR
jgi:hypothetical protein